MSLLKNKSKEDGKDYLRSMEYSVLKAVELANYLMTFSIGGEPVRDEITIGDLLYEIVADTVTNEKTACSFSISPDLLPVPADRRQIVTALKNLIRNSCESMPDGGLLTITAENYTHSEGAGNISAFLESGVFNRIIIRDDGCGISETELARIFDLYYSTKQKGAARGLGLGLSVSHSVINRHGGSISIKFQLETGTTVEVYLPTYT